MRCEGSYNFRSLEKREAGEFINERGLKIKYPEAYKLNVDEQIEGKIYTRTFVFPITDKNLYDIISTLSLYDPIIITFDVLNNRNNIKLVPVDVICER